ncbi:MAG TPA: class I SAM-dependent methyltransferase [Nitrososphaeraceae archaeon]|nr:class I SAM-dependent methyltransferase [Nitrososphaeraceae archaeon]
MTLKTKIDSVRRHPSIIKDIIQFKNAEEIRAKVRRLDEMQAERQAENEALRFITHLKRTSSYHLNPNDDEPKLNRLCYIEDWKINEIKNIISELQKASLSDYIHRKDWEMNTGIVNIRKPGFIHRKDWEWALGIVAMRRFDKLTKKSTAIGVGAGREEILFYLANNINHVYATDLYDAKDWKNFAPSDFPENPKKYAPFPYNEDALTVLRMNGTKLEFPSENFDIAFSFSSIEHFGGKNHSGALRCLREIERVLKRGGIAVIATEYIINNKEHHEFFNRRTIYSDLINKLEKLQLVEPLDLRLTTNTLDTVIELFSVDANWDNIDEEYKKTHPLILIRARNILFTSVMLVFQKH